MSPRAKVYVLGFPNGKCYVGITSRTVERRFKKHVWDAQAGSPYPKHRALMKYGPENVAVMTIVTDVTWAQAQDLETWWISRLNTFGKSGYNMTAGGEGMVGHIPTAERRAKQSKAMKGFRHTAETRGRMSQLARGRTPSIETRAKIGESNKETNRCNRKKDAAKMRGKTWGRWTVLSQDAEKSERCGQLYLNCRCECGKLSVVLVNALKRGDSKGCKVCGDKERSHHLCKQNTAKMQGKAFGRWTVLSQNERLGPLRLNCRCECGKLSVVLVNTLKRGDSKGCIACGHKKKGRLLRNQNAAKMQSKTFGRWTVLSQNMKESKQRGLWLNCRCSCGVEKTILGSSLRRGRSKGCQSCAAKGHRLRREKIIAEMVGKSFGRWTVLSQNERRGPLWFNCHCECDRQSIVTANTLKNGDSKGCRSCGARGRKPPNEARASISKAQTLRRESTAKENHAH